MATIATTSFDPAFDTPVISSGGTAASGGGDVFQNKLGTRVYINNGDATATTVTFARGPATIRPAGGRYGTLANANLAVSVPAGAIMEVTLPPGRFNPDGDAVGNVSVTYSKVTSLTMLVLTPE